jgi:hypothetical protein
MRGIRDSVFARKPVTHGALGDMKKFPHVGQLQATLDAQVFEAQPSIDAGLRSTGGLLHLLSLCSTMFIMLIKGLERAR